MDWLIFIDNFPKIKFGILVRRRKPVSKGSFEMFRVYTHTEKSIVFK